MTRIGAAKGAPKILLLHGSCSPRGLTTMAAGWSDQRRRETDTRTTLVKLGIGVWQSPQELSEGRFAMAPLLGSNG